MVFQNYSNIWLSFQYFSLRITFTSTREESPWTDTSGCHLSESPSLVGWLWPLKRPEGYYFQPPLQTLESPWTCATGGRQALVSLEQKQYVICREYRHGVYVAHTQDGVCGLETGWCGQSQLDDITEEEADWLSFFSMKTAIVPHVLLLLLF